MENNVNEELKLKCLRMSSDAVREAVRIYNLILDVGHGKITSDNALHQMLESYKEMRDLSRRIHEMYEYIESIDTPLKKEAK